VIVNVQDEAGIVEVSGNGPPLVFVGSPLARTKTYHKAIASLGKSFRVSAVELPGCGPSVPTRRIWTVRDYAEWLHGFITQMHLEKPIVLGHSHAGPITVAFAAHHPTQLRSLILVDATGPGPNHVVPVMVGSIMDLMIDLPIVVQVWHHVVGNLLRQPQNLCKQMSESLDPHVEQDCRAVRVPTLLVWGRRANSFPRQLGETYARLIPKSKLLLSTGGAHAWILRQPEEFAAAVRTFAGR
jgi:pimeloyl-ACP methyl ester carboxylesterase